MAGSDNLQIFNIEVPADVINDNAPAPKKSNKKLKNERVVELPIGETSEEQPTEEVKPEVPPKKEPPKKKKPAQKKQPKKPKQEPKPEPEPEPEPEKLKLPEEEDKKEELSNTSMEVLAALEMISDESTEEEILLEPIEEEPPKPEKTGREAQKRTTKKKAPAKKLATPEEQKKVEALKEQEAKPPIQEITVQPVPKKAARETKTSNTTSKILSYIIPTQSDGMNEIIRKGIVIICIVVLLFSMGILIRSTHLENKASKENAGNYFVNKYIYSYEVNKDNKSKDDTQQSENTDQTDENNEDSGEENK